MPLSSSPTRTPPARSPWADAPALTVVLVVAALTLVIVPVAQMLGPGAGSQHGLEPFMELVAVLLGLLVVSVSLHTLDPSEQARANVLVAGFGGAAAGGLGHGAPARLVCRCGGRVIAAIPGLCARGGAGRSRSVAPPQSGPARTGVCLGRRGLSGG